MSGMYMRLKPGRYMLQVPDGEGPAGVQRSEGEDVRVDVDGGTAGFTVPTGERVYYWWRGPERSPGVRLLGSSEPLQRSGRRRDRGAPRTPRAS